MKIILKKLLDNLVAVTLIYLLMVVVIGFLAKDIASAMGIAIVLTIIGFVDTLIMIKTDMDKNIQNCNVSCTDLMNYICSCMQHNFYPPGNSDSARCWQYMRCSNFSTRKYWLSHYCVFASGYSPAINGESTYYSTVDFTNRL